MRKVCARWIPRFLTADQKQRRVDAAVDFLQQVQQKGDTFLHNIITAEETWVYYFEPESKLQSSVWKHPNSPPPMISGTFLPSGANGCRSALNITESILRKKETAYQKDDACCK